ncbi:MAG: hypothetical protein AAF960_18535 [Bacteroidota bacterium]
MSGCSIHHFRTIDRPLSPEEMEEIDSWSSRFSPTSTGVTYIYHYGSFKQSVNTVFPKYFDAMLHINNWGTKRLLFRLPKDIVDRRTLSRYENSNGEISLGFWKANDYIILDLQFDDEHGGGWLDEDHYSIDRLVPLREEILNGDYRSLYLGWLMVQQNVFDYEDEYEEEWEETEEGALLPPIPANLQQLTAAQKYLMEAFDIEENLVKAAATFSPNTQQQAPNYRQLITLLSDKEKDDFLIRFAAGEKRTDVQLRQRLEALGGGKTSIQTGQSPPWARLLELSDEIETATAIELSKQRAAAHAKKMEELRSQKAELWKNAESQALRFNASGYDQATKIIIQLKQVADYENNQRAFEQHLGEFITPFIRRPALIRRLRDNGLLSIKG